MSLPRKFEVTDDSGFMALVDPDAYDGFVDSDWSLDQIFGHFKEATQKKTLLLWGTGRGGMWAAEVGSGIGTEAGFREFVAPIQCSQGRLLVTNYESLTMVAQFNDEALPQKHEQDQLVELPVGLYRCRVAQIADPDSDESYEIEPAFRIELEPCEEMASIRPWLPWREVPRGS